MRFAANKLRTTAFLVLASTLPSVLTAQTNLGPGGYPSHSCGSKPQQPERPEVFESESQIQTYNAAVDAHNTAVEAYFVCVQQYVDHAATDIERIKEKVKATIEETNTD